MAQKLAGSLALVTCKEPLKSNLGTHLRQYLADHGFSEVRPVVTSHNMPLTLCFQDGA